MCWQTSKLDPSHCIAYDMTKDPQRSTSSQDPTRWGARLAGVPTRVLPKRASPAVWKERGVGKRGEENEARPACTFSERARRGRRGGLDAESGEAHADAPGRGEVPVIGIACHVPLRARKKSAAARRGGGRGTNHDETGDLLLGGELALERETDRVVVGHDDAAGLVVEVRLRKRVAHVSARTKRGG